MVRNEQGIDIFLGQELCLFFEIHRVRRIADFSDEGEIPGLDNGGEHGANRATVAVVGKQDAEPGCAPRRSDSDQCRRFDFVSCELSKYEITAGRDIFLDGQDQDRDFERIRFLGSRLGGSNGRWSDHRRHAIRTDQCLHAESGLLRCVFRVFDDQTNPRFFGAQSGPLDRRIPDETLPAGEGDKETDSF